MLSHTIPVYCVSKYFPPLSLGPPPWSAGGACAGAPSPGRAPAGRRGMPGDSYTRFFETRALGMCLFKVTLKDKDGTRMVEKTWKSCKNVVRRSKPLVPNTRVCYTRVYVPSGCLGIGREVRRWQGVALELRRLPGERAQQPPHKYFAKCG